MRKKFEDLYVDKNLVFLGLGSYAEEPRLPSW